MIAAALAALRGFNWRLVVGIGLLAAIGFLLWRIDRLEAQRDKLAADLVGERVAHAITRKSVDDLLAVVARQNADIEARGAALTQARERAVRAAKQQNEAYRQTQGKIDALRARVGLPKAATCLTPAVEGI